MRNRLKIPRKHSNVHKIKYQERFPGASKQYIETSFVLRRERDLKLITDTEYCEQREIEFRRCFEITGERSR